jgi:hypothetical protein
MASISRCSDELENVSAINKKSVSDGYAMASMELGMGVSIYGRLSGD